MMTGTSADVPSSPATPIHRLLCPSRKPVIAHLVLSPSPTASIASERRSTSWSKLPGALRLVKWLSASAVLVGDGDTRSLSCVQESLSRLRIDLVREEVQRPCGPTGSLLGTNWSERDS